MCYGASFDVFSFLDGDIIARALLFQLLILNSVLCTLFRVHMSKQKGGYAKILHFNTSSIFILLFFWFDVINFI